MNKSFKKTIGFTASSEPDTQDYFDFNAYLAKNSSATITVQAGSDSMSNAGINKGDLLVIDRSLHAKPGNVVMVDLCNSYTIRRLKLDGKDIELHTDTDEANQKVLKPSQNDDWAIVGVVSFVIKKLL